MQDFTAGGVAVLNQLTNALNNEAQNERARVYLQAEQRRQLEKNFEVKTTLANQLLATDPQGALELFNDGLRGFGMSVTMDQFHPAMKGFEAVADLMRANDHQGAQLMLASMKQRGMLVNLNDAKRALSLEQELRQQQAAAQADTVMRLQYPGIDRAQQTVNAYRAYQQGQVPAEDLHALYGTTDMADITQRVAKDEAIVQGFEEQANLKSTIQTALANNPTLGDDLVKTSLMTRVDPEKAAKAEISRLLQLPSLDEAQNRRLNALASVYGSPQLQESLGLKNAANAKRQLQAEMEALGERLGTLQDTTGVLNAAEGAVASISPETKGAVNPSKPMDERQAQDYAKLTTIRLAEGQKFLQDQAKRVKDLDRSISESEQQMAAVAKQLVGAPAGRKETLRQQQTELERSLSAQHAMKRLLTTHNPYQLAAQEAAVAQATTEDERDAAKTQLTAMQRAYADDLDTVQEESVRLQRRQRMLTAGMSEAERKEELEQRQNLALTAVFEARNRGVNMTQAVKDAVTTYKLGNAAALMKSVNEMMGPALIQAQNEFALLPSHTPQVAAMIARKYGVSVKDVLEGIKDPNKPLVSIQQNAPSERKDIAGGRSQLDMVGRIQNLYHPDFVGPVDSRVGRVKSLTGLIKEQEAEFRSAVKLMRVELRKFYFGTAQSRQELAGALEAIPDIDMSDEQFRAALTQTEKNIKSMLSRQLETMEQSDVKAPKPKPFESRYRELEATGLSKPDIFKKLQDEGY